MNSIAVLLNDYSETCSWLDTGEIKLYKKENEEWIESKSLPYSISTNSSIVNIRKNLSNLIEKLDDCKVLVAKEVSGQLFSILEAYCFNVYELNGTPSDFLDSVLISETKLQKEEALLASQATNKFFPEKIDKFGNYTIDLKKLLQEDGTVSSKQILILFLKEEEFESLEVVCDHVPKWFDRELANMGYNFHTITRKDGNISVSIFPTRNSK
ncbi:MULTISPECIES: Fe-only nitrogenase accessory protein AnfO [unclassified Clostridium]|uniref:Fe-only nitrogenase accessory protein AnfO n=1 Tax=unclassified Clostridium TaxID=2614128 RepID=UPI0002982436|nr:MULTISPECIES: Fe-only nitrogenase accessory protein AnfO [unclassified Clostridium]EKQ52374.1 MAG: Fe-only nitrogenase accessory protein AnfO [Clostridium sp. Maddingley MBC34-26]